LTLRKKNKVREPKGKTIDPQNWGGAELDEDETDLQTQEAMLKNFEAQKLDHEPKKGKSRKTPKNPKTRPDDESESDGNDGLPKLSGPKKVVSAGHA
jgi:hypothetical protein